MAALGGLLRTLVVGLSSCWALESGAGVHYGLRGDTPLFHTAHGLIQHVWFPNISNSWHELGNLHDAENIRGTFKEKQSSGREKRLLEHSPKTHYHRWEFFRNTLKFFNIQPLHVQRQSHHKEVPHLRRSSTAREDQNFSHMFESLKEINALTKTEYLINKGDYRLPKLLFPLLYDLALRVFHWGNGTFNGHVNLTARALDDSSLVFLHSSKLNINWGGVKIFATNATSRHALVDYKDLLQAEMIALVVRPPLQRGVVYTFYLEFEGRLALDEYGLYSLQYDSHGQTHYMALAQLQTKFARLVFPCMDEPVYKAKFSLRLARPANSTAVSNTRLVSTTQLEPGWVWDHFDTTPLLSTYMITFAVITFESLFVSGPGITFSVWTRPGLLLHASYALQIVPRILYYLQEYLTIKYPLDKLDVIAVPSRYARAVENLGLISMHETMMEHTPSSNLQDRITTIKIVAHELSHTWFGNLVTPEWWDSIWLSEGFATFLAAKATTVMIPDGYVDGSFVAHEQWMSLSDDIPPLSRPIQTPVLNNQTMLIFDEITYNKGACLVRMLEFCMGEAVFRKAVSTYLRKRAFSTSDNDDLLRIFDDLNRKHSFYPPPVPMGEIMHGWMTQIGYPLVTITRLVNGTALVHQRTFSYLPPTENTVQHLFWVPIGWISQEDNDSLVQPTQLWLPPTDDVTVTELLPPRSVWFIANAHRKGFYRVNYDSGNWELLAQQLRVNHEMLSPTHRAQILDDAFHIFCAGLLEEAVLERLLSYVAVETHAVVWQVLNANANLPYREGVHPFHFPMFREKLSHLLRI